MSDFRQAAEGWTFEVEQVAAQLVERGVPTWQAIERAREIVSERRQKKARAKS